MRKGCVSAASRKEKGHTNRSACVCCETLLHSPSARLKDHHVVVSSLLCNKVALLFDTLYVASEQLGGEGTEEREG